MFILYEIIQVSLIITWSIRYLLTLIIPLKQTQYKVPASVEGNESVQQ